mgnify:CR=1 FL=1|tara:strand:+ start:39 stop:479 length:441 start_codon:yes stop_codon:yes gene_type:complete
MKQPTDVKQHFVARDLLEVKEEIGKLIDTQLQNIIDQSNYIAKKNLGLIRYKASYYTQASSSDLPKNMTYDEAVEWYFNNRGRDYLVIEPMNDDRVEGPLYAYHNHFTGYVNRVDPEKEIACPSWYPRETAKQLIKQLKEQQKQEV